MDAIRLHQTLKTRPDSRIQLQRAGLSPTGADEAVNARPISSPADRSRILKFILPALGFAAETRKLEVGHLVPAVQKIRGPYPDDLPPPPPPKPMPGGGPT